MNKLRLIALAGFLGIALAAQDAAPVQGAHERESRSSWIRSLMTVPGPQNVALVLDCSAGIGNRRFEFIRRSAIEGVKHLKDTDLVSIVGYGSNAFVVAPSQPAKDKEALVKKIKALKPEGEAALFAGISAAAEEIRRNKDRKFVNRVVVLGSAFGTVGPSSVAEIDTLTEALAKEDIHVFLPGRGMVMRSGSNSEGPWGGRPGEGGGPRPREGGWRMWRGGPRGEGEPRPVNKAPEPSKSE